MANQEHLNILRRGVKVWNVWRQEHPEIHPDLSKANFREADLERVNFAEANLNQAKLCEANLGGADLCKADLSRANLREANLYAAYLEGANLKGANLTEADLNEAHLRGANLRRSHLVATDFNGADLRETDLSHADLRWAFLFGAYLNNANLDKADLSRASLIRADLNGADLNAALLLGASLVEAHLRGTNLSLADLSYADLSHAILTGTKALGANFSGCRIHGISVWDMQLEGANQLELIITPDNEPEITIDNLELAQFIYLLLNNQNIRRVIDTITSKVVLILGRFRPERKIILDVLRKELRKHNYSPVLFDFEKPSSRNFTETVRILAHLSRFIIADLTDPSSIPQELQAIVPTLAVPVQPILLKGKKAYAMFVDLQKNHGNWVLPIYYYTDQTHLLAMLKEQIIEPAEQRVQELGKR